MNTKTVERNVMQAMMNIIEVEERIRAVYALLDSVRASLEEETRKEADQLKQLNEINERIAHEEEEDLENDEVAEKDAAIKPPTDEAVASLENQQEKPFLQAEKDHMRS